MALNRVWIPSPNYSSRNATVRLIVIHSSEGAQSYQSLGNFFANPSSQVSSHVGIDNTPNVVGEYVKRSNKAWTAGNANPVAVQAELCTPSGASANWSTAVWYSNPTMLANLAKWIREEAAAYNIPIVRLTPQQAQGNGRGVCQHLDLGSWGGGHVDCGPAFPIDSVIAAASGSSPTPTPPVPIPEVPDMVAAPLTFSMRTDDEQMFYVNKSGTLVHYYYTQKNAKWLGENLSSGWDPDTALSYGKSPNGPDQVWGRTADGKAAQCYWAGTAWVTQPVG